MENFNELKKTLNEHLSALDRTLREAEGHSDNNNQILASVLRSEKRNLVRIIMVTDLLLKENETKGQDK